MSVRHDVLKAFPNRGPMQQRRLASVTTFACFRCGAAKTSKLVTVVRDDWNRLLCNGCYGRLLSIYDVKAGTASADERAARLAELLGTLMSEAEVADAKRLLGVQNARTRLLSADALRFLATAEAVSVGLRGHMDLDWSVAIIGLCKAFEVELVRRVVDPLREACVGVDLSSDVKDGQLGRVAAYCAGRAPKPPEMGALRFALAAAENSVLRAATSPLVGKLRALAKAWPGGQWLFDPGGGLLAIEVVTLRYRNPAAHVDTLERGDFENCREFVSGASGALWKLLSATSGKV